MQFVKTDQFSPKSLITGHLTHKLCSGLVRVQGLHLLHVLCDHGNPLLGGLLLEQGCGDVL